MNINKINLGIKMPNARKIFKATGKDNGLAIGDGFKASPKNEELDADKMKSFSGGAAKKGRKSGKPIATILTGLGIAVGGFVAGAVMGGPLAPALMGASMFTGFGMMVYGMDDIRK